MELQFLKEDPMYSCMLSYLDSSVGIRTIVTNLPYSLYEKWTGRAMKYKTSHSAVFPPFSVFVDFIKEMSKVKSDPSFIYNNDVGEASYEHIQRKSEHQENYSTPANRGREFTGF